MLPSPGFGQVPFSLIHRGFATDYQIIQKFEIYKSFGQDGWELYRLINEEGLVLKKIPYCVLPDWYPIGTLMPKEKIDNTGELKFEVV